MSSVLVSNFIQYPKLLNETEVRCVAGALVHGRMLDQAPDSTFFAELTLETEIALGQAPSLPILKFGRSEHIEKFFTDGVLRLGTLSYYAGLEHAEQGDCSEGSLILVEHRAGGTTVSELRGGFNNYVFCCFSGSNDVSGVQQRFGYDAAFEIVNVVDFATEIGRALKAHSALYGICVYRRDKVLVSVRPDSAWNGSISANLFHSASDAKYFIKPLRYAPQSEFRFLWRTSRDVHEPIELTCPAAARACRRWGHD